MKGASISWYSRALRHCVPDIAVTVRLPDGYRLRLSIKRHIGLLRRRTRDREYATARRLAGLTGSHAVIYDIGANIGLYTVAFAANRTRKVHSYEPSELALPYLRQTVSGNQFQNVQIHSVLLSDAPGTRNFVLDHVTTAQSHVSDIAEGGTPFACIDLDGYVHAHSLPAPNLVKIDVEGHDLSVLHGMRKTLQAKPLVYVEGGVRAEDGRIEAISFLLQYGYSIWNLERTVRLDSDTQEYAFLAVPAA